MPLASALGMIAILFCQSEAAPRGDGVLACLSHGAPWLFSVAPVVQHADDQRRLFRTPVFILRPRAPLAFHALPAHQCAHFSSTLPTMFKHVAPALLSPTHTLVHFLSIQYEKGLHATYARLQSFIVGSAAFSGLERQRCTMMTTNSCSFTRTVACGLQRFAITV